MALKDWKKVENKKKRIVFYRERDSRNIFIFLDNKKWTVDLDDSRIPFKDFKTFTEAISFAKEYMRIN